MHTQHYALLLCKISKLFINLRNLDCMFLLTSDLMLQDQSNKLTFTLGVSLRKMTNKSCLLQIQNWKAKIYRNKLVSQKAIWLMLKTLRSSLPLQNLLSILLWMCLDIHFSAATCSLNGKPVPSFKKLSMIHNQIILSCILTEALTLLRQVWQTWVQTKETLFWAWFIAIFHYIIALRYEHLTFFSFTLLTITKFRGSEHSFQLINFVSKIP